jgi:hypothetical protein
MFFMSGCLSRLRLRRRHLSAAASPADQAALVRGIPE